MHVTTKRGNLDNEVTYDHFCDKKADMTAIDPKEITLGSVCVIIEDESKNNTLQFMLAKSDKTWKYV